MKLTPWFSGDQKPVRVGVYERDYGSGKTYYCWWNGKVFGCGEREPGEAKMAIKIFGIFWISADQNLPWRGVLK